jgi:hypothetical protein
MAWLIFILKFFAGLILIFELGYLISRFLKLDK